MMSREPDKLRIFVNYALKTPEYECLSNFSRIFYCCNFSASHAVLFCFVFTNLAQDLDAKNPSEDSRGRVRFPAGLL